MPSADEIRTDARLDPLARRVFYAKHAAAPMGELADAARWVGFRWLWPLNEAERRLEAECLEIYGARRPLYHGGAKGLRVGDRLLPGAVTGADGQARDDPPWKARLVYATPSLELAEKYSTLIDGAVYVVEMEGEVGVDLSEIRTIGLILDSPQFLPWQRITGGRARRLLIGAAQVCLTAPSALVLEVRGAAPRRCGAS
jgi:hypothetical protein